MINTKTTFQVRTFIYSSRYCRRHFIYHTFKPVNDEQKTTFTQCLSILLDPAVDVTIDCAMHHGTLQFIHGTRKVISNSLVIDLIHGGILGRSCKKHSIVSRDHSGCGIRQWETTLHSNIVSHWLNPYPARSLVTIFTWLLRRRSPTRCYCRLPMWCICFR